MVKNLKLQKPKILEEPELMEAPEEYIDSVDSLRDKLIENTILENKDFRGFSFDSCIFRRVVFINCDFSRVDMIDCIFEGCDLSNASFSGGSIHRVEFIGSKLVGARFDESNIKDVLMERVSGRYLNLSFSKVKGLHFIDSDLQGGIFQEVKKEGLLFRDTNLTNGYFNKTPLNKVDFTTCNIAGIDVEIENLKGAEVTALQALELTRLMGLIVK